MLYPVTEKITGKLLQRISAWIAIHKSESFVAGKTVLQQLSIAYIVAVSEWKQGSALIDLFLSMATNKFQILNEMNCLYMNVLSEPQMIKHRIDGLHIS